VGRSVSSGSPEKHSKSAVPIQLGVNSGGELDVELAHRSGPRNCWLHNAVASRAQKKLPHDYVDRPPIRPSVCSLVGLGPSRPCRLAVSLGLWGNTKVSKFLRYKHVPDSLPKFPTAPGIFPGCPSVCARVRPPPFRNSLHVNFLFFDFAFAFRLVTRGLM